MINYCSNCGNKVKNTHNFCMHCGKELKVNITNNNNQNIKIYEKSFNIAGISYREKDLLKILNNGVKTGDIKKYKGLTKKERIEECELYDDYIGEFTDESIDVTLNKTVCDNKEAIEVLADNFLGTQIMLGYIPKSEVKELITLLDKQIIIWATIVGGKQVYFTEEDNIEKELNLGVKLKIQIYDNK